MTLTKLEFLNKRRNQLIITILVSILCFFLLHKSGTLSDAGMAAIFLNWVPFIVAILSILIYFIVNIFTKHYSWIVLLLGNILNIVIIVAAFSNH